MRGRLFQFGTTAPPPIKPSAFFLPFFFANQYHVHILWKMELLQRILPPYNHVMDTGRENTVIIYE